MSKLENGIYNVLMERGSIGNGWKINITNIAPKNASSDWANVTVMVTKPRCRKPFMIWDLVVYMPRDQVWFDKSTFCYL